jgi:hypothetical protein
VDVPHLAAPPAAKIDWISVATATMSVSFQGSRVSCNAGYSTGSFVGSVNASVIHAFMPSVNACAAWTDNSPSDPNFFGSWSIWNCNSSSV